MRQRWRLAELRAEEYAFVLLSQFTTAVEAQVLEPDAPPHCDPCTTSETICNVVRSTK